jgi:hypothetical protein
VRSLCSQAGELGQAHCDGPTAAEMLTSHGTRLKIGGRSPPALQLSDDVIRKVMCATKTAKLSFEICLCAIALLVNTSQRFIKGMFSVSH